MVEEPILSPDFTLEDIRKLRDYDYEMTKNMTDEEKIAYYNTPRTDAAEQIARLREKYLAEKAEKAEKR